MDPGPTLFWLSDYCFIEKVSFRCSQRSQTFLLHRRLTSPPRRWRLPSDYHIVSHNINILGTKKLYILPSRSIIPNFNLNNIHIFWTYCPYLLWVRTHTLSAARFLLHRKSFVSLESTKPELSSPPSRWRRLTDKVPTEKKKKKATVLPPIYII